MSLRENKFQHIIPKSLGSIIRGFKIGATKWRSQNNREFQWQKSFYDHIICDEKTLDKIREYIRNNPPKWELLRIWRKHEGLKLMDD